MSVFRVDASASAVSRKRKNAGVGLIILSSILLLGSATAKLAQVAPVMNQLAAQGFSPGKVMFIALLEVLSALLFLIPVTRSAGLLLMSSFLGGAIATHLQHSQSIAGPSVVLLLIWLGTWLRHPEVLWSRAQNRWDAQPAISARQVVGGA